MQTRRCLLNCTVLHSTRRISSIFKFPNLLLYFLDLVLILQQLSILLGRVSCNLEFKLTLLLIYAITNLRFQISQVAFTWWNFTMKLIKNHAFTFIYHFLESFIIGIKLLNSFLTQTHDSALHCFFCRFCALLSFKQLFSQFIRDLCHVLFLFVELIINKCHLRIYILDIILKCFDISWRCISACKKVIESAFLFRFGMLVVFLEPEPLVFFFFLESIKLFLEIVVSFILFLKSFLVFACKI